MIHDVLSMSAGIREDRERTIFVTFDRRIRHESVIDFANRVVSDLIKSKGEGPESAEPSPRQPEKTPPSWGTEREKACAIANMCLALCDAGTLDPDSDHAVLCRQYGRAIEKISRVSKVLTALIAISDERHSLLQNYTIEDLNREASDDWPEPKDVTR